MALALLWTLALGQATLQLHDSTGTGTIEFEPTAFATLSGDVNGINVTVPVSGANFLLAGAATGADPGKATEQRPTMKSKRFVRSSHTICCVRTSESRARPFDNPACFKKGTP